MRALTLSELILLNILREREAMAFDRAKLEALGKKIQTGMARVDQRVTKLDGRADQTFDKSDKIFDGHESLLTSLEAELKPLEDWVNQSTNGGPNGPLPGSGVSPPQPAADAPRSQKIWPID